MAVRTNMSHSSKSYIQDFAFHIAYSTESIAHPLLGRHVPYTPRRIL